MKHTKQNRTLLPTKVPPLHVAPRKEMAAERGTVVVVRTEKRSWLVLAVTGFGAFLLRYIRSVRERGKILRSRE